MISEQTMGMTVRDALERGLVIDATCPTIHVKSNYDDVITFQKRFSLPAPAAPRHLQSDVMFGRIEMILEELRELMEAYRTRRTGSRDCEHAYSIAKVADALIDLNYFVLGTAAMMGLPWEAMWDEVQRANMTKEPIKSADESKRNNVLDVRKPANWQPPDLEALVKIAWLHDDAIHNLEASYDRAEE